MLKGYNTDIVYLGANYHIQTEDWGEKNPYLVSRVFLNGAVIKSLKMHYEEVVSPQVSDKKKALSFVMKVQHEKILELLTTGQLL